jgi:hypothetical protein
MLTIRKEQFAVFQSNELTKFEEPTYLRLNSLYPAKCQDLGETHLRKLIRYGVQRAASYEITRTEEVRTYIDVMMLLGPDFDKDANYPWAKSLLQDEAVKDAKIKVDRLHQTAIKQLSGQA